MPGIGDSVDREARLTGRDDSRFGSRRSRNGKTIDIPAGIRRRGDGTKGALDLIAFRKRGMASTRWRINNRGTRGVEHYFAPSLFNFIYL